MRGHGDRYRNGLLVGLAVIVLVVLFTPNALSTTCTYKKYINPFSGIMLTVTTGGVVGQQAMYDDSKINVLHQVVATYFEYSSNYHVEYRTVLTLYPGDTYPSGGLVSKYYPTTQVWIHAFVNEMVRNGKVEWADTYAEANFENYDHVTISGSAPISGEHPWT